MKTAEHYLMRWRDCEFELDELIELAQKEAYNQALEDAVNPHEVDVYYDENVGFCIVQQSILKLKK